MKRNAIGRAIPVEELRRGDETIPNHSYEGFNVPVFVVRGIVQDRNDHYIVSFARMDNGDRFAQGYYRGHMVRVLHSLSSIFG